MSEYSHLVLHPAGVQKMPSAWRKHALQQLKMAGLEGQQQQ